MQIHTKLEPPKSLSPPYTLTIGNFDGVHRGHEHILKELRKEAGSRGTVAVITFSNHPSSILPGRTPVPQIIPLSHKLHLLECAGADLVYLLEFTHEFAKLSYDTFLHQVKTVYPFELLILGKGATLGKNRGGTPQKLKELAQALHFSLKYLEKIKFDGETVSSGKIRACLEEGNISKAIALLGHPLRDTL